MTRFGHTLMTEQGGPKDLIRYAVSAFATDLRNADAKVVEEEVVVDGNLVISRSPSDLPAFCSTIVKQLTHAPAGA
jgi:protease I